MFSFSFSSSSFIFSGNNRTACVCGGDIALGQMTCTPKLLLHTILHNMQSIIYIMGTSYFKQEIRAILSASIGALIIQVPITHYIGH